MEYKKSSYPIGARWELVSGNKKAWIELSDDKPMFEVWYFGWSYIDGSGAKSDWTTSYKNARSEIPFDGKFKRVK